MITNIVWLFFAYLLGSIPTAYIVGKRVRNIDIRQHGSGNVGATNVFRVIGKKWGAIVLLCDFLKGLVAVIILAFISHAFGQMSYPVKQLLFGAAAIAGHTWSPWLKLKGGKGIATAAGILVGIFPWAALASILIWLATFLIGRYVSLASIIAVAVFPLVLFIFHRHMQSFEIIFLATTVLAAFLIYNHRTNISRLRQNTEPRVDFSFGKKKSS
jgi:glycerol-3-phosphate acyltransferase PlsY